MASIKNNSIKSKKWGKNNSGNLVATTPILSKHDQTNDNHSNNTDILSETDLLNSVDMNNLKRIENNHDKQIDGISKKELAVEPLNELNKSKSKWGVNCGSDASNKKDNNSNNSNKNDQSTDDPDEMNHCEINQKLLKRKAGNNFTRYKTVGDKCDAHDSDEIGNLPSKDKKNEENHNLPPASSQIQVTYWKEDVSSTAQSKINSRSSTNRGQKLVANQKFDENQSTRSNNRVAKDDITDRILVAAKAANSTKSYKS